MFRNSPPRTTKRLRDAINRRISRFGSGRMEIHSAILEALVREADEAERCMAQTALTIDVSGDAAREAITAYRVAGRGAGAAAISDGHRPARRATGDPVDGRRQGGVSRARPDRL